MKFKEFKHVARAKEALNVGLCRRGVYYFFGGIQGLERGWAR
jgi:hypothetical protein